MLDLKAKLLAAGLVTAEQVKKVEDDETVRKQRAKDAREAKRHGARGPERGPEQRAGRRPEQRSEQRSEHRSDKRREPKSDADLALEKEARKEHALVEAERWRKRLTELAAAGKAEQYDAIRGWVLRHRLDSKQITEAAERFHFTKMDGSMSHLTVEPDVRALLAAGEAALVAFMGFNGLEHGVVPKDVALDLQQVKPEWLRALVGVTDVAPPQDAADSPTASSGLSSSDEPVSDS
jgi:uncharacterized protein YaiL (DUF2058 family)